MMSEREKPEELILQEINRAKKLIKQGLLKDASQILSELKFSYICECGVIYCGNCAQALTDLENLCWSCENPIDYSKPVKKFEEQAEIKAYNKENIKKRKEL